MLSTRSQPISGPLLLIMSDRFGQMYGLVDEMREPELQSRHWPTKLLWRQWVVSHL